MRRATLLLAGVVVAASGGYPPMFLKPRCNSLQDVLAVASKRSCKPTEIARLGKHIHRLHLSEKKQ